MAFGFIVERFDILIPLLASRAQPRTDSAHTYNLATVGGLLFIVLGVAMIVIATVRFFRVAKEIDTQDSVTDSGALFDIVLAALLTLLGLSLVLYLIRVISPLP
jgi:uncharacterized membrane protein YidH (DUF202 family)